MLIGTAATTMLDSGWFKRWCDVVQQRYSYPQLPSKHEALAQCWADVGPSSTTLAQHQPNIGPAPRVCWVYVGLYTAGGDQSTDSVSHLIQEFCNLHARCLCLLAQREAPSNWRFFSCCRFPWGPVMNSLDHLVKRPGSVGWQSSHARLALRLREQLAQLFASFDYLCYGLRPLEIFQFFHCGDHFYTSESVVSSRSPRWKGYCICS